MDLERLAVELRPRTNWEAIDLGATMVRAWWKPLYAAWLAVLLPAAALAIGLLGAWGLLLLWWLKPLFDRIALFVLARSVFGDPPTARESLRAAPSLLRGFLPDALLVWRFDPARSFHLPTWQLEGLRGAQRRQRARVLDAGTLDVAGWLTFCSVIFELGFFAALLALGPILTPDWAGLDWDAAWELFFEGEGPAWLVTLLLAGPVIGFAFLEPFYCAAGFALYLNRRTRLEGWDLEIAFRRLAGRARQREEARLAVERRARTRRAAGGLALLLAAIALATAPTGARAQESATGDAEAAPLTWEGPASQDPRTLAEDILAEPEFEREELVAEWQLKDFGDGEDERFVLPGLSDLLGLLFWTLAWCAAAALLCWLVIMGLRSLGWIRRPERSERPQPPRIVAGLDISPESLPDDPASAAEAAWLAGRREEALSLLYRASLASLVNDHRVELRESDTEEDCLEAARRKVAAPRADYLGRLTRGWLSTAYAHRPPPDEIALPLIRDWRPNFGRAA